jgi:hypothetical protein
MEMIFIIKLIHAAVYLPIGILTINWEGSAIGGDIVLELTPSFFFLKTKNWLLFKNKKIGCYFIVIKIKEKRRCQFKNNISSYCRSSPSSGQDSN